MSNNKSAENVQLITKLFGVAYDFSYTYTLYIHIFNIFDKHSFVHQITNVPWSGSLYLIHPKRKLLIIQITLLLFSARCVWKIRRIISPLSLNNGCVLFFFSMIQSLSRLKQMKVISREKKKDIMPETWTKFRITAEHKQRLNKNRMVDWLHPTYLPICIDESSA